MRLKAIFAGLGAGVQSVLEARSVDDSDPLKPRQMQWVCRQDRSKMTVLVGGLTALALGVSVAYRADGRK